MSPHNTIIHGLLFEENIFDEKKKRRAFDALK